MSADNTIQDAIDAISSVLNIHENHLYPKDSDAFRVAIDRLEMMKEDGFK